MMIDRRTFLTTTGLGALAAGLPACRRPGEHPLFRYLIPFHAAAGLNPCRNNPAPGAFASLPHVQYRPM